MPKDHLDHQEREALDLEMMTFAAELMSEMIRSASTDRKNRGAENTETVYFQGNIDGVPYAVFMPPIEEGDK